MKTYDAKDCVVTFGTLSLSGFSEDMITAAKDEEFFTTSVGAQGDVVVNTTNNPLGTITVTLQATSPVISKLKEFAKSGTTQALYVKNSKLGERVGGAEARIKNYPEIEYGGEVGDRQFEFQVFDYEETEVTSTE